MRAIKVTGEIDRAAAGRLRRDLDAAHGDDVTIEIDSHGGSFVAGLHMYSALKDYQGHSTARIIHAGSAATLILCGCTEAVNTEKGTVFVHEPTVAAVKDIGLSIGDMQEAIGNLQRTRRILANIYALKDSGGFPMHKAPGVWETILQRKGGTTWGPGGKARFCDSYEKPAVIRASNGHPIATGLLGQVVVGALQAGVSYGALAAVATIAKNGRPRWHRATGEPFGA